MKNEFSIKDEVKLKNQILNKLSISDLIDWEVGSIAKAIGVDINEAIVLLDRIYGDGYITIDRIVKGSLGRIRITNMGSVFIKHGGYKSKSELNKPIHWSGIGANLATIILGCVGLYTIYQSVSLRKDADMINKLEKIVKGLQVDSIKTHAKMDSIQSIKRIKSDSTKK